MMLCGIGFVLLFSCYRNNPDIVFDSQRESLHNRHRFENHLRFDSVIAHKKRGGRLRGGGVAFRSGFPPSRNDKARGAL